MYDCKNRVNVKGSPRRINSGGAGPARLGWLNSIMIAIYDFTGMVFSQP